MKPTALNPRLPAAPVRLRRLACGLWLFATAAAPVSANTPASSKRPLPEALKSALQTGLFEEEANRDYDKAIAAYREALDLYDAQRPTAGTVIYRLAECLRRNGQPAEAIPLYRRVLAEFPADTDLVLDARRRLEELNAAPASEPSPAPTEPLSALSEQETEILADLRVLAERNPDMLPLRAASYFIPAVEQRQIEVLKFFIKHRVKDLDFDSAIRIAVGKGSLPMVRILLEASPGPKDLTESLTLAVWNKDLPLMEFLLPHEADIKKHGTKALMAALVNSQTSAFYRLIDAGVDLNTTVNIVEIGNPDSGRLRPLAWALEKGNEPLVRYLVEKGARCDLPSESDASAGAYPLHQVWNADLARFLLGHGADREALDPEGGTPVLKAAVMGCFDVVEALAAAGADLKAMDKQGWTLINHLVSAVSNHPAFGDPAKLPQEFYGGSKPLRKDDPRIPELRAAAVRVLDAAVKAGVPINGTPSAVLENAELHPLASVCKWAVTSTQVEFVEQMIKRGADVNFADMNGVTPLHSAALLRSLPLIRALLDQGANPLAETTAELNVVLKTEAHEYYLLPVGGNRRVIQASETEPKLSKGVFFRYRPMDLIGARMGPAMDREAILLLARFTYARDFPDRNTGVWQECSILGGISNEKIGVRKIADAALDGETPVDLLEAVMRAEPGLASNAGSEVHILRRRGNDSREAEDLVYDLRALTTASPPAFPALRQGDVILLLPRPENDQSSPYTRRFEPLAVNLALTLEVKQPMEITLTLPENLFDRTLEGKWRIFRPLVSKVWTDTAGRTSWMTPSLRSYGVISKERVFDRPEDKNLFEIAFQSGLNLARIIRDDGKTILEPDEVKSEAALYLRNGDRVEFTDKITGGTPDPFNTGKPQENAVPAGEAQIPVDSPPPAQPVTPPSQP